MTNVPYTFDRTHSTAEVHQSFDESVETGQHTEHKVSVAGRLMLRRGQGKLAFGQLHDSSGQIQLFAPVDVTPNFEDFTSLSLGDWLGVTGTVMKTRKGELSIQVEEWVVLAEAKRQFPDKWHGLQDTDTRYRQRYVDLWVTPEARAALIMRSKVVGRIRSWLHEQDFMEVETPVLHPILGGATAKPFSTHYNALDMDMYLRIAPELYLKRLIVGGFEKIFEISRNFRNEGLSPRHNPEFTAIEIYQAYGDYNTFMELMENLVSTLALELTGSMVLQYQGRELDLTPPWPRRKLVDLVSEAVGEEVSLETSFDRLKELAVKFCGHCDPEWGKGKILLELYEKTVETELWNPIFVADMPKEVSPLARDHRSVEGMTEHVDAVVAGRELGPIYTELVDAAEQRARLEDQVRLGKTGDDEAMQMDEDFLRALEYGMPPTAGLGLGIDRLVMMLADVPNIKDVLAFPQLRPEQPE